MDRFLSAVEVRAEGRTLEGVALPYGELSPSHRERFEAGGGAVAPNAILDLDHDRLRTVAWIGAGLTLTDTREGLHLRAEVPRTPAGDEALRGVRTRERSGLSIEFEAARDRTEAQTGVRVVEAWTVHGVGLVERASYPSAMVEARQRTGPPVRGSVALGERLACGCRDGCDAVRIAPDAFDAALREAEAGDRVITAFFSGRFDRPLARVGAGLTLTRERGQLGVRIDGLPDSAEAGEFLEAVASGAAFQFRPYFPDRFSDVAKAGTTAEVARADLRGIEIAAISGPTEGLREIAVGRREDRRRRVWL